MWRWRVVSVVVLVAAAGCAGASLDAVTSDSPSTSNSPSPSTAVSPSSVPTSSLAPVESESTVAAPPSSDVAAESVQLGAWQWAAPCRVPVLETIGGDGIPLERRFAVNVDIDPSGVAEQLLTFEEVAIEPSGNLTEPQLAAEILRYGALLPPMRLDVAGRFVEFVDLAGAIDDAFAGAGPVDDVQLSALTSPEVADSVVRGTIGTWYGLWQDRPAVPFDTVEEASTRPFGQDSYATEVQVYALGPVSGDDEEPITVADFGPVPVGVVLLSHYEVAGDPFSQLVAREYSWVDSASQYVDTTAVVEPGSLRTLYAVQHGGRTLYEGTDVIVDSAQFRRTFTFDWDQAEGCGLDRA
jgi:hypothetical protein